MVRDAAGGAGKTTPRALTERGPQKILERRIFRVGPDVGSSHGAQNGTL